MSQRNRTSLSGNGTATGIAPAPAPAVQNIGLPEQLRKALIKADEQGRAMHAYIAAHTFHEDSVAEDEAPYPKSVLV